MKMIARSHAFLALALASSFSLLTACEEKKPEGTTSTTSSPAEPSPKGAPPQTVDTPAAESPAPSPAAENAAGDGGHVAAAMAGDGGHATDVQGDGGHAPEGKGDGGHVTDPKKH